MSVDTITDWSELEITDVVTSYDEREAEWMAQRSGKLTCSQFPLLCKLPRDKDALFTGSALTYLRTKIAERLGSSHPGGGGASTAWGHEHEPEAVRLYAEQTNEPVDYAPYRFIEMSDLVGGSPDGLVGDDGCLEVKCPYNPAVHINTLLTNKVPDEYLYQCVGHMLVTGRQWCDFVSFDPRMSGPQRMVLIRMMRDQTDIDFLQRRLDSAAGWIMSQLSTLQEVAA